LIGPTDYLRAYSALCQKLPRAVERLTVSSHDEALSVEIGQLNAFVIGKPMIDAGHQSVVFPQQLDRTLPRLALAFCRDTCEQLPTYELSMQLFSRSIDKLDPRFRQLAL